MEASSFFCNNKTPKMILLEICKKMKIEEPQWKCEQLQVNPPIFKSTCHILKSGEKIEAEGIGTTKKQAEQNASFKMLPKLVNISEEFLQLTNFYTQFRVEEKNIIKQLKEAANLPVQPDLFEGLPVSDVDDDEIHGNPIGELSTLCARNKLGEPDYLFSERRGPNNVNIFTCTVSVGTIVTRKGMRNKKQDAKKVAAFKTLESLKSKYPNGVEKKSSKVKTVAESQEVLPSHSSKQDPSSEGHQIRIQMPIDFDSAEAVSSSVQLSGTDGKIYAPSNPLNPQKEGEGSLQMETEIQGPTPLKRKFGEREEEQNVPSSSSPAKRKYELLFGNKLYCFSQSEICVRLIKDYAHVFQHLPPNPILDEALKPKKYQRQLNQYGGPLKLLEKSATELNAKLIFFSDTLNTSKNNVIVWLVMILRNCKEFKVSFQKRHTFAGIGTDLETAKSNAAINCLTYLREMMFCDDDDEIEL